MEGFAQLLEKAGTEVNWIEAGEETGQGRAIRFKLPSQHSFEIYYDVEKPKADEKRRSVLKNQTYKAWIAWCSPRRFDHVNIATSMDVGEILDYLGSQLGFKLREYVKYNQKTTVAGWMSVTPLFTILQLLQDHRQKHRTNFITFLIGSIMPKIS